jgi:hypothetical protein
MKNYYSSDGNGNPIGPHSREDDFMPDVGVFGGAFGGLGGLLIFALMPLLAHLGYLFTILVVDIARAVFRTADNTERIR